MLVFVIQSFFKEVCFSIFSCPSLGRLVVGKGLPREQNHRIGRA